ncbi:lipid droplet-regulating VLDL assembly factor AUP1-like [Anthonomus grandis grandis]|uniref:lipid droplet-regulating VLDL assembly factor AUP1-like n=1 Tax=Anthonomus grandis grandis TaxID=2921223 RepID=UPI002166A219|nr:lipid droplet-regulating VLDL assembly factor AUP1-like [Anthonomus grandis grandis]
MVNLEIKQLVNKARFPESDGRIILNVLYLPIGFILLFLRGIFALILMLLGQVLPETPPIQSFLTNLACICFGITVSVENSKKKEHVDVFVSNSLSIFDHVAVSKAVGTVLPLTKTPLKNLPAFGIPDLGSVNNTDTFKKNLESISKEKNVPIYVCPEEASTNGRALLKFNSKYFKFFQKVQPLCITIKRPLFDLSISTLKSTCLNDIIYFMYSPFTNYSIKFLPSMEKKCLSEDEFAEIVRENIASELKIEATNFSSSDLSEWRKRQIVEERRRQLDRANMQYLNNRMANPELARMAAQVKEVLPHVPVTAIYNDLAFTRSVDTTITNILEGRVRFVPESNSSNATSSSSARPESSSSCSSSSASPTKGGNAAAPSQISVAASTFGKTATERTRSFQERKEQLIAAARRRYIEKHNLEKNIPLQLL